MILILNMRIYRLIYLELQNVYIIYISFKLRISKTKKYYLVDNIYETILYFFYVRYHRPYLLLFIILLSYMIIIFKIQLVQ